MKIRIYDRFDPNFGTIIEDVEAVVQGDRQNHETIIFRDGDIQENAIDKEFEDWEEVE